MKTLRWYRGEQVWFTELGAAVAANDMLNEIKDCLRKLETVNEKTDRLAMAPAHAGHPRPKVN